MITCFYCKLNGGTNVEHKRFELYLFFVNEGEHIIEYPVSISLSLLESIKSEIILVEAYLMIFEHQKVSTIQSIGQEKNESHLQPEMYNVLQRSL